MGVSSIYTSCRTTCHREPTVTRNKRTGPWTLPHTQPGSHVPVPTLRSQVSEHISTIFTKHSSLSEGMTEDHLYLLLLATIEGLTYNCTPKNNTQLIACVQTISNLSLLLEDLLSLWIDSRTGRPLKTHGETPPFQPDRTNCFLFANLLYRIVLRVWLVLTQNTLMSLTTPAHNADLQALLSRPITMVTGDSLSLNRDWLFLGNKSLDIEFSFTFLESLYASTSVMNFFNTI